MYKYNVNFPENIPWILAHSNLKCVYQWTQLQTFIELDEISYQNTICIIIFSINMSMFPLDKH